MPPTPRERRAEPEPESIRHSLALSFPPSLPPSLSLCPIPQPLSPSSPPLLSSRRRGEDRRIPPRAKAESARSGLIAAQHSQVESAGKRAVTSQRERGGKATLALVTSERCGRTGSWTETQMGDSTRATLAAI